jgi:hypothetical protein
VNRTVRAVGGILTAVAVALARPERRRRIFAVLEERAAQDAPFAPVRT